MKKLLITATAWYIHIADNIDMFLERALFILIAVLSHLWEIIEPRLPAIVLIFIYLIGQ